MQRFSKLLKFSKIKDRLFRISFRINLVYLLNQPSPALALFRGDVGLFNDGGKDMVLALFFALSEVDKTEEAVLNLRKSLKGKGKQ